MSNIDAIEDAVRALPPQELARFRAWFAEFDFAAWDAQIDADASRGALDDLLAEAERDLKSAPAREV